MVGHRIFNTASPSPNFAFGAAPVPYAPGTLDHTLLPYPSKAAVYLRLVNTAEKAKTYALAGFHVSTTRGLAGGCGDLANSIGAKAGSMCQKPLNRTDLRTAWAAAAEAYYNAAFAGGNLEGIKSLLAAANVVADRAYAAEGVAPPRDPALVDAAKNDSSILPYAEPATAGNDGIGWGLAFAGVLTAATVGLGWVL